MSLPKCDQSVTYDTLFYNFWHYSTHIKFDVTCQNLLTHFDTNGSFISAKHVHVEHILVTFVYIEQHITGYIITKLLSLSTVKHTHLGTLI